MDYSNLLDDDILEKIVRQHLPTFSDRYHFSLVCKSWNSVALRHPRRLPGLLSRARLPDDPGIYQFLPFSMMGVARHYQACPRCGYEPGTIHLESVTSNPARREMLPRVGLPVVHHLRSSYRYERYEVKEEHIVACLDGWLLITKPRPTRGLQLQIQLHLLNPITRATIALPLLPLLHSRRNAIIKAVLSSSPDNVHVECHIIVLFRNYLAWCKVLGEGRGWKFFGNEIIFKTEPIDVSYYGERLYVRDYHNVYVVHDLIVVTTSSHRNSSTVTAVSVPSLSPFNTPFYRLAPDLAGQLLIIDETGQYMHRLVVSSSADYEWERVTRLDGYAVFFGTHQSFSLPASDDRNGVVIANRIYSPSRVWNLDFGCFAPFSDRDLIMWGNFWFLPMQRDVIGEHMKSEKGFSYWSEDDERWLMIDSSVCEGNRFHALLSTEDDE